MDLNRILVPLDGSRKSFQALDRALTLAGFTHGHVTCIHVIPHVIDGGPRTKAFDKQLKKMEKYYSKKQKNEQEQKCKVCNQTPKGLTWTCDTTHCKNRKSLITL